MPGPAVTIVASGGIPVKPVTSGAPALTLKSSGGIAVTVANAGTPFVVEGYVGGEILLVPTLNTLVANRLQYNTATQSVTQPATYRRQHHAHPSGAISAIKTIDVNRYLSGVAAGTAGNAHTIKRTIEYPQDVFTPVLWGGSATIAITSGQTVTSDVVAGLTIPAGAKFWERTVVLTTVTRPCMELPAGANVTAVDDGSASGDFYNSGTISPGSINTIGANMITGTVNATAARAFVLLGDSLVLGTGDITNSGSKGGAGWPARLMDQGGWPYFKMCKGGQGIVDAVTLSATINANLALFAWTDLLAEHGINDLSLNSRTKAQVEADYQTIFALSNIVGKRIYKTTITPRTTSTDSWATTANQTPTTTGTMADLTGLNTDIRAGLPNVTGVIDAADAAMSARDSLLHKAPPAGTPDGTHPNSTRHSLIASLLTVPSV